MDKFTLISGRHAVEEALDRQMAFEKIFLARSVKGPFEKHLRHTCRERNIPLAYVEKNKLDKLSRSNHQGVVAFTTPLTYYTIEDLVPYLIESRGNPMVVMADGITDVRNIGAIARTCEVLGVHGFILPMERTALINEFAIKTSAGALLHLPLCRTNSLVNAADYLIQSGFRMVGLDGRAENDIHSFENTAGPLAVILGDEEKGIRQSLQAKCHDIFRIKQKGNTESLNVSVAAGIALYHFINNQ